MAAASRFEMVSRCTSQVYPLLSTSKLMEIQPYRPMSHFGTAAVVSTRGTPTTSLCSFEVALGSAAGVTAILEGAIPLGGAAELHLYS